MQEVIYYRCDYCDKDFDEKDKCSRHEKAEYKKYKNIDTILTLKKRDITDTSLYFKFFEDEMTDAKFDICPADLLTRYGLSSISQKSLTEYAKRLEEYEKRNSDREFKLLRVIVNCNHITFTFEGSMNALERYDNSFYSTGYNVDSPANIVLDNFNALTANFLIKSSPDLLDKVMKKVYKVATETKLSHDGEPSYMIDYVKRIVASYDNHPEWHNSKMLKFRKFGAL